MSGKIGRELRLKKYRNSAGVWTTSPSGGRILARVAARLTREWHALPDGDPYRFDITDALQTIALCISRLHPEWRDKL